jgi:hypothetical protein
MQIIHPRDINVVFHVEAHDLIRESPHRCCGYSSVTMSDLKLTAGGLMWA